MCDLGDMERCDVWSTSYRRAKKERRCDSCGTRLLIGRRYFRLFMVFDGNATVEVACLPCARAAEKFGKEHHWTPSPSYFPELLEECIDGGPEGRKWRPMLRAWRRRHSRTLAARAAGVAA